MKTAPAASHAERATTLASLPLPLQLATLEFHAQELNVDWLKSALDDGHFDVMADDGQQFALQKFAATTRFLTASVATKVHVDPEFGQLARPMVHLAPLYLLENTKNEGFPAFYADLVAHVVDQVQRLQDRWPDRGVAGSEDQAVWGQFDRGINSAFAKAMVACAALDLPESVRLLAETQPEAMKQQLDVPQTLGERAMLWDLTAFVHPEPGQLTPYAMALFFSRATSMQAMVDAGFNVDVIGAKVSKDSASNPCAEVAPFDVLQFREKSPVMGLPSAFKTALEHRRAIVMSENDNHDLNWAACLSLSERPGKNAQCDYRHAFHAVGAFEIQPRTTMRQALKEGNAEEIQRLQTPIEWPSFASSAGYENTNYIMEAMANAVSKPERREDYENALIALIEKASADGEFDFVFGPNPVKSTDPVDWMDTRKGTVDVVRMQPMAMIIGNDFSRAIAKMMDQGLDVKRPLAEGALPLIEYAEKQGAKTVVATMRAHLARTAAHSLLDEMDDEPTKAAPR